MTTGSGIVDNRTEEAPVPGTLPIASAAGFGGLFPKRADAPIKIFHPTIMDPVHAKQGYPHGNVGQPRRPSMEFVMSHHEEILHLERNNGKGLIYLYDTGGYWCAFEQSACRLHRIFPESDISILHFGNYPFPVVMAAISDGELRAYSRRHLVREPEGGCRILSGRELSPEYYRRWRNAVDEGLL